MTRVVVDAGEGAPWLTLVHGLSQNHHLFDVPAEALRSRYRLLLVDLAGHGDNTGVAGPYGPEEYLDGVRGAMAVAGVDTSHYWGTHTGAAVGLLLATREPRRLRSLVLEGAVIPGAPPASVAPAAERARKTLRDHGLDAARREWFQASPWFLHMHAHPDTCRADAHRALVDAFQGGPWSDDTPPRPVALDEAALRAIPVPTLLLNGEQEVADFLPTAARLAALLPRSERRTVPGGGFPVWEYPEAVTRAVAAFLGKWE